MSFPQLSSQMFKAAHISHVSSYSRGRVLALCTNCWGRGARVENKPSGDACLWQNEKLLWPTQVLFYVKVSYIYIYNLSFPSDTWKKGHFKTKFSVEKSEPTPTVNVFPFFILMLLRQSQALSELWGCKVAPCFLNVCFWRDTKALVPFQIYDHLIGCCNFNCNKHYSLTHLWYNLLLNNQHLQKCCQISICTLNQRNSNTLTVWQENMSANQTNLLLFPILSIFSLTALAACLGWSFFTRCFPVQSRVQAMHSWHILYALSRAWGNSRACFCIIGKEPFNKSMLVLFSQSSRDGEAKDTKVSTR